MEPISAIWEEHKSRLRRYVATRVQDRDALDDILLDVFLKAHHNLHTLKSRGSITAWLFRIASNAIADHYRSWKTWVELPDEMESPEPEPVGELAACLQLMRLRLFSCRAAGR